MAQFLLKRLNETRLERYYIELQNMGENPIYDSYCDEFILVTGSPDHHRRGRKKKGVAR